MAAPAAEALNARRSGTAAGIASALPAIAGRAGAGANEVITGFRATDVEREPGARRAFCPRAAITAPAQALGACVFRRVGVVVDLLAVVDSVAVGVRPVGVGIVDIDLVVIVQAAAITVGALGSARPRYRAPGEEAAEQAVGQQPEGGASGGAAGGIGDNAIERAGIYPSFSFMRDTKRGSRSPPDVRGTPLGETFEDGVPRHHPR
ncbi:MAG: hypothetical protein M3464_09340 [Chloroflexota bacterium]|nr:hypothetical protein [Chloroflexota bacterium]